MTPDDDTNTGNDWLKQAMEGEDAAGCISVGGLAVDMGWYKDRGMTDEQIAAERERFIATRSVRNHPEWGFGDGIIDPESCGWLARAEIASAEQAELRERVRELAKGYLRALLTLVCDRSRCTETTVWRSIKTPQSGSVSETLLKLAEEAGVWFDDDGNEVPLAEWRERMGGAG